MEFPTPIQAEDFTLSISELAVVPNGGDGRVIACGLRSSARTSDFPVAAPFAVDSAAGMSIDTGYGWRYVIDAIEFDATAVRVTYHVEGDIDGLVALPPQAGDEAISIPFPQDGRSGAVLVPAGRADHVRLVFEPAGRPIDKEVSLRLVRSGAGLWSALDLPSLIPDAAGLTVEEGEYVSIRLTAPTAYTGRGAPGNNATLTDNLGNAYRLYHGSASMPPRHSQWDFVGPLAIGVSELSLTLPGYLAIEEGSWELLVELR
ncbi:MAG: hypothetical protein GEU75_13480 [Dehalococcoidia bacterium]|nr:hypothetical protein [Dehalococcoidia bacterium]